MIKLLNSLLIILAYLSSIASSLDCYANSPTCDTGCVASSSIAGCSCDIGSNVDLYFTVGIDTEIGRNNFVKELAWLQIIAGAALQDNSGFSMNTYDRSSSSNTYGDIATISTYSDVEDTINSSLSDYDSWDGDSIGARLSAGIYDMIDAFTTRGNDARQKIALIVANSNPSYSDGRDSYIDDVCLAAPSMKQDNIRAYVVLVGTDPNDFNEEYFHCIVEDKDTDIIIIPDYDSFSDYTDDILNLLCQDTYQFKITEVKAMYSATGAPRFVEVYNLGMDIDGTELSLDAFGVTGLSGTGTISQGDWFVFYDNDDGSNGCSADNCFDVDFTDNTNTDWTVTLTGSCSACSEGDFEDSVMHNSSNNFWQTIEDDYTFELRAMGYASQYGSNWRMSCDEDGTPGAEPDDFSCTSPSCSADALCTNNGDTGGVCDGDSEYCECTTGEYSADGATCVKIPLPRTCTGYWFKEEFTTDQVMQFVWTGANYDGSDLDFTVEYRDSDNNLATASAGSARGYVMTDISTSRDKALNFGTVDSKMESDSNTRDSGLQCFISTVQPTQSPTADPTEYPTEMPTDDPTDAPTYADVGFFIQGSGDFCDYTRCDCFNQGFGCCNNIQEDNCTIQYKEKKLKDADDKVSIVLSGTTGYPFNSFVCWRVTEVKTVNRTDYKADNETRRRRMTSMFGDMIDWAFNIENDNDAKVIVSQSRHLLANSTFPASETTSFGRETGDNELLIDLYPESGCANMTGSDPVTGTVTLQLSQETLQCESGDLECGQTCDALAVEYLFEILNCTTENTHDNTDNCTLVYPTELTLYVERGDCDTYYPQGKKEDPIPDWLWWVLLALIIFLIFLGWLVYRFWWKQKKAAAELGDAEEELEQQKADNEIGFGGDLDAGDVVFNTLATGVPGVNRPADVYSTEIDQRQAQAANEMADAQAEVFKHQEVYGQVHGQNRGY